MKIKLLHAYRENGKKHKAGENITVTEKEAERLFEGKKAEKLMVSVDPKDDENQDLQELIPLPEKKKK